MGGHPCYLVWDSAGLGEGLAEGRQGGRHEEGSIGRSKPPEDARERRSPNVIPNVYLSPG